MESYQKTRPSLEGHEEEDDTSNLVHQDDEINEPHRRKNRPQQQHHSYNRHLSFEGFFPNDKTHGFSSSWNSTFKRRAVAIVVVSLVAFVVILHATHKHSGGGGEPTSSTAGPTANGKEPTTTENKVDTDHSKETCLGDDPIMALKNSSTVEHMQGAVASDTEICSNIGASILSNEGGNAVDAAVATALCLGVVNPASSGIGGGAMLLVHSDMSSHKSKINHEQYVPPLFHDERDANYSQVWGSTEEEGNKPATSSNKVTEFIDCREEAPSGATMNMFKPASASSTDGGLAIAVPGEARGLELAHSRHGKLPWSKVVEPAMKLARDGFPVGAYLAHEFQINKKRLMAFPNLGKILTKNNDGKTLLLEGETLKLPQLAETLKAVMEKGADAIYKGELAEKIISDIQEAGGIVTTEDLASYRPVLRSPLVAHNVHGYNAVGVGPPSSGGAAIIGAARFLAGYANPFAYMADSLSKHRLVEASKHVFAIRMSLSDPAFNTNETLSAVADLVTGPYMEELRRGTRDDGELPMSQYGGSKWAKLNDGEGQGGDEAIDANEGDRMRRRTAVQDNEFSEEVRHREMRRFGYLHDHGTTHLSVIDKDRNAVSITSTVNTYFGSKVASPSTGIIFNNQMDDFATPGKPNYFGLHPSESNYIAPKKRPLSSMSPTMVFQPVGDTNDSLGNILMVLGASGGPKIISAVLQVFLNFCLLGMPLYQAVASPRVHDQLLYHGKAVTTLEREPILQGPTIETTQQTVEALKKRGHSLLHVDYMGTVQAVAVDTETDTLEAVSDIRKGGKPAGH